MIACHAKIWGIPLVYVYIRIHQTWILIYKLIATKYSWNFNYLAVVLVLNASIVDRCKKLFRIGGHYKLSENNFYGKTTFLWNDHYYWRGIWPLILCFLCLHVLNYHLHNKPTCSYITVHYNYVGWYRKAKENEKEICMLCSNQCL